MGPSIYPLTNPVPTDGFLVIINGQPDKHRLPFDIIGWNKPPLATIRRIVPIVTHDKKHVVRDSPFLFLIINKVVILDDVFFAVIIGFVIVIIIFPTRKIRDLIASSQFVGVGRTDDVEILM